MSARRTKLAVLPLDYEEAAAFVDAHHRRHRRPVGHRFSLGAVLDGELVGVVIVGRPVGRKLQDGLTVEITRLCTRGARNVCSFLYGAATRASFALGYRRVITYIAKSEPGTSLVAAGFRVIAKTPGRSWDVPSRRRIDLHPLEPRLRFERSREAA